MNIEQINKIVNTLNDSAKVGMYPRIDKQILIDALSLIGDLLNEISGLNSAIETLQGVAKDFEHRNENLINENKYLRERLAEEMEQAKDMRGT